MDNLTIVIPFRNGHATLGRLLHSLPADILALVVDDLSTPPLDLTAQNILALDGRGRERVRALRLSERGYFSGAVNAGIATCATDVLVLNQDVWIEGTDWLDLVRAWQAGGYAIAGGGVFGHPAWPQGYVQGQFMFLSRAAIQQVGLLNTRDYPLWGSTCEWQLRACRAGFQALPVAEIPGFHHERVGAYGESIQSALRDEPQKESLLIRTPPLVSVVITCHNNGRYLPDAVHSLVGGSTSLGEFPPQTLQSCEVIIVDDASTDETPEIGKALADDWRGIHFVRMDKWGGSAAAMNVGIRAAHGKYIAPLDGDDLMEPTRLEMLWRAAEQHPHAIVYDDPRVIQDGRRADPWPLPEYDFDRMLEKNPMHKGIFFPRAAWQEVGGYPEVMRQGREDWAFNIALGAKGWCGVHVAQALYLYRREGQNRSLMNAGQEWRERFMAQLVGLYPNLYAGERPSMCCGKGTTKTNAPRGRTSGAFRAESLPGAGGMIMLQYQLDVAGPKTYYGAVTGQVYVFGGQRKTGYVDARDAPGLLNLLEGRRQAFARYTPPVEVKDTPSPAEQRAQTIRATLVEGGAALAATRQTAAELGLEVTALDTPPTLNSGVVLTGEHHAITVEETATPQPEPFVKRLPGTETPAKRKRKPKI